MEAFEQFVAVALSSEGYIVSSRLKFPVARRTKKQSHAEVQEHGYEVDLVGARADRLLLVSVKSFFGSAGVKADDVLGDGAGAGGYRLLNDAEIRDGVIDKAASRYGYSTNQIRLRFCVGRFAGKDGTNERRGAGMVRRPARWGRANRAGHRSTGNRACSCSRRPEDVPRQPCRRRDEGTCGGRVARPLEAGG